MQPKQVHDDGHDMVERLTAMVDAAESAYLKICADLRSVCEAAEGAQADQLAHCEALAAAKAVAEQAYKTKCAELDAVRSSEDGGSADSERCAELEAALREAEQSLIDKASECGEIKAAEAAAKSALRAKTTELESVKRTAEDAQRQVAAEIAEANAAWKASLETQSRLQAELEAARSAAAGSTGSVSELEERCAALQKARSNAEVGQQSLLIELEETRSAKQASESELASMRARVEELEQSREVAAESNQTELDRVEQAESELQSVREALDQARADKQVLADLVDAIAGEWSASHAAILDRCEAARDAKGAKALDRAVSRARASIATFQALLDSVAEIAGLQDGSRDAKAITFDPREIAEASARQVRPPTRASHRVVTSKVVEEVPPYLVGDVDRIQQILLSMLVQACRFAPDGQIELDVSREESSTGANNYRFSVEATRRRAKGDSSRPPETARAPEEVSASLLVARRLIELMEGKLDIVQSGDRFAVWFLMPLEIADAEDDDANRRQHARLPQEGVQCNLGTVLNLSLGGIRIRGAKVPQGPVPVVISSDSVKVSVSGEVAWSRRIGFRKYEIGVRFIGVSEAVARQITGMASTNRYRRSLDE